MAIVNVGSIFNKCKKWSQTAIGQARMQDAVRELKRKGDKRTLTLSEMKALAEELRQTIINTAAATGVPPGVMDAVSSLSVSGPVEVSDGIYEAELSFGGNLHRNSLYPEGYPGGVDNIIALFNNGYNARDYVYANYQIESANGTIMNVRHRSQKDREALRFMNIAVNMFNGAHSGVAKATLSGAYEG